ncbi:unnamed protein product [Hermetia illucens]|uniref:Reverse transcriptase domain-containing protein n=1 Tax=Hermetia illucens TaxID=343691 RepID=A0A7R8Z1P8_HERIL|nr:unnamed protein product [Hermetia illucens]
MQTVVNNGLPQGSCLSPTLFNLYTAELHKISDAHNQIFQFADDCLLLTSGPTTEGALKNAKTLTEKFSRLSNDLRLKINHAKSKLILFNRTKENSVQLEFNQNAIRNAHRIKYLGILLTNNLITRPHFSAKILENSLPKEVINFLTNFNSNLHPQEGLNIFRSLLRSRADYATPLNLNIPKYTLSKVESQHRTQIKRILGLSNSTPNHVVYVLAKELPLEYRQTLQSLKSLINTHLYHSQNRCPGPQPTSPHAKILAEYNGLIAQIQSPSLSRKPGNLFVHLNIDPALLKSEQSEGLKNHFASLVQKLLSRGYAVLFTDASKTPQSTTCATLHLNSNGTHIIKINPNASIQTAELTAINLAIKNPVTKNCNLYRLKGGVLQTEQPMHHRHDSPRHIPQYQNPKI